MTKKNKTGSENTQALQDVEPSENHSGTLPEKSQKQKEIGGREGLDPTRFGDWEKNGRCVDF